MTAKTAKQILKDALSNLKPHDNVKEYGRDPKRELKDVKEHIKERFETAASDYVIHEGMSRKAAEEKALKHALFRCESWMLAAKPH